MTTLVRQLAWLCWVLAAAACGSNTPGENDGGGGGGGNDITAPRLVFTVPSDAAAAVSAQANLSLEFSEAMAVDSVVVKVTPEVALGPPTWTFAGSLLELAPATAWAYATTYTVEVSGTDLAGNALAQGRFSFTTEPVPDTTPPQVTTTLPPNASTNVPRNSKLSMTFSRSMNIATVQVTVSPSYNLGAPEWADENRALSFPAAPDLAGGTDYTISIAGEDVEGRPLPAPTGYTFRTSTVVDTTPPVVLTTSPSNAAVNIPISANISVTFNERMDKNTVEAAFSVTPAVSCTFMWDSQFRLLTCDPVSDLSISTSYTVQVGTGAKDLAGNALASQFSGGFTTSNSTDTTPPTVVTSSPTNQGTGYARSGNIQVTFSEPMDKAAAQSAFAITVPAGFSGGVFNWDADGKVMTYNPPTDFGYGQDVTWRVSTAAKDLAGNALATTYTATFKVVRQATQTLTAVATLDGHVNSNGTLSTSASTMLVGDLEFSGSTTYSRSFLTFDLSALPSTVLSINSATLSVYMTLVNGNPFGELGSLWVDHYDYGGSLETTDLDLAPLSGETSRVLTTSATVGLKTVTATTKVANDWSNRVARANRCQYRLRFTTPRSNDNAYDYAVFSTANSSTNKPTLTVTYEYP